MPKAELSLDGEHCEIAVDSGYVERDLVRSIPGASYSKDRRPGWHVPLSWASCCMLRGLFGDALEIGPRLWQWAAGEREHTIDPAMAVRQALSPDDVALSGEQQCMLDLLSGIEKDSERRLHPYQRLDVAYLATMEQALLANEPGLGKTASVIRTLQVLGVAETMQDCGPVLIVCPDALKRTVWERELNTWAPELTVAVVEGSISQRRRLLLSGAHVMVMNYETMRLHTSLAAFGSHALTEKEKEPKELNTLVVPKTVVFDEAHRITTMTSSTTAKRKAVDANGNPVLDGNGVQKTVAVEVTGAQTTRAAWTLAHQANYVFALTGTPLRDNVGQLWTLLHMLDRHAWPSRTKWLDRYATQYFNPFGGVQVTGIRPDTADELYQTIDPWIRRVPKELALPQLPPVLPVQYRETPMTPKQAQAYRQMSDYLHTLLTDGSLLKAPDYLSQFTRLCQMASGLMETAEDGGVRMASAPAKLDDMVELLAELDTEPLVVAGVSRQLIDLAAARLDREKIPWVSIVGDQGSADRQWAVDRFQKGAARVMLLTLGAGAEGLTLTRANRMLFLERSWSQIQNLQAQARIHRIGSEQHGFVQYYVHVTPGTVEQVQTEALEGKQRALEEILRDRQVLAALSAKR